MKMLALLMMMVDGGSGEAPEIQLLDFSANYCQPCKQMVPVLEAMARDGFPVRQIDITEEHELARRFRVDRVPTLVLIVEGKEEKRFVGLTSEAELRREMNAAARKLSESRHGQKVDNVTSVASLPEKSDSGERLSEGSGSRPSLGEKLKSLLGGSNEPASIRAQSPESDERLAVLQRAFAATVRVKVTGIREKDGATVVDVGTGTIVHSVDGHAIVLTCAHLFLGISKKGPKIVVEVFENGKATAYSGEILGGTHESDLAFIKFQTAKLHTAVSLTSASPKTDVGDALMSFGCNDGADPTPLETKLVDINFYQGPDNLICEHDPAGGRSGGGLFNTNGELVAICSCADRERKRGLYMAHSSIVKLANKLELTSILKGSSKAVGLAIGEDASAAFEEMRNDGADATPKKELAKADEKSGGTFDAIFGGTPLASNNAESKSADNETQPKLLTEPKSDNSPAHANEQLEPEVVIEIVDRENGGKKRRVVIPKASPWLLEVLTGEGPDDPTAVAARYQKELEATRSSANELTRTSQTSVARKTAARRSTSQAP